MFTRQTFVSSAGPYCAVIKLRLQLGRHMIGVVAVGRCSSGNDTHAGTVSFVFLGVPRDFVVDEKSGPAWLLALRNVRRRHVRVSLYLSTPRPPTILRKSLQGRCRNRQTVIRTHQRFCRVPVDERRRSAWLLALPGKHVSVAIAAPPPSIVQGRLQVRCTHRTTIQIYQRRRSGLLVVTLCRPVTTSTAKPAVVTLPR